MLNSQEDGLRVALIEHYDSFSHNLIDWLERDTSTPMRVVWLSFDNYEAMSQLLADPLPLVLSPGPHSPQELGPTVRLVQRLSGVVPMFGVCLGAQLLAYASGASVVRSAEPWHGSRRTIAIDPHGDQRFTDLPERLAVATYNSLCIDHSTLGTEWRVVGSNDHGEPEIIVSTGTPLRLGVQFHPESFLSEDSHGLRSLWFDQVSRWYSELKPAEIKSRQSRPCQSLHNIPL